MPTYEYKCESCDYMFEEFQSMHDEPIKLCPQCGGPVRKLISSSYGVIFKGSGFYETDYKHNNADYAKHDGKTKEKSPSKKPEAQSKPAPKVERKKAS